MEIEQTTCFIGQPSPIFANMPAPLPGRDGPPPSSPGGWCSFLPAIPLSLALVFGGLIVARRIREKG